MYLVVIEDRHCDVDVEPFEDKEKAISRAKFLAKKYCRYDEDFEENQYDGYLYYANYSCESDSVSVIERSVNKEK